MKPKKMRGLILPVLILSILLSGCGGEALSTRFGDGKAGGEAATSGASEPAVMKTTEGEAATSGTPAPTVTKMTEGEEATSGTPAPAVTKTTEGEEATSSTPAPAVTKTTEGEEATSGTSTPPLSIARQPEGAEGNLGERVALEVTVSGGRAPLAYRWQYAEAGDDTFHDSVAEGNTSNVLRPPIEEKAYDYRCVVTDADGASVTSAAVRVQRRAGDTPLSIARQPEGAAGNLGERVTLEVTVSGGRAPLAYRWQYAEAGDDTFHDSVAEGNTSNVLRPPIEEKAYDYRCVVTDADGASVTSAAVRVQESVKFLNLEVGKTISPSVEDASIPMINRLGCGYDVFGSTAANAYVREPVLDLRSLLADGLVQATRLDHAFTRETVSESIKDYAKKITNQASVKGGFLCFKGSVNTNFTNEQQREESNYFATYERILQRYRTYILGRVNLQDYVIPEVAEDLANRDRSVEDLFKTYGHYVIVNTIVGGKVVYNCTSSSVTLSSFDSFKIEARASCDLVFASAGASYGHQTTKETSQFNARKVWSLYSDGGAYSLSEAGLKDAAFVRDWEKTLESKGALIDFDENVKCLVPIWEFCPDKDRAEELKKAFEASSKNFEQELPDQKHQSYRYLSELWLGVQDDAQKARKEAAGDSAKLIDVNLNLNAGGEHIYLARTDGISGERENAITDILISTKHESWVHEFNHNGQKDTYRLLVKANESRKRTYHPDWCNLNHEAGGDKLWLYYTRSLGQKKSPIYDIMVYDAGSKKEKGYPNCLSEARDAAEEGGWEIVCFAHSTTPADLNNNAGGHALFLFIKRDTRGNP